MDITETLEAQDRAAWRAWLAAHHATRREIWLLLYTPASGKGSLLYLHAVEEALCFGWIDGIAKKFDQERTAQRFTPRRPKSNWTELNKERARRLIAQGLMTPAGYATLPDLSQPFQFPEDILETLRADPQVWENFQRFPEVYKRIRVGYINEVRKQPDVFAQRLSNFMEKTRKNKLFGTIE